MLQPVRRQSLSDQVFQQLRDQIVGGALAPGADLPSERELAAALQVNRGAVREALQRLAQARLVAIRQGGATRILDYRQTASLDLLAPLLLDSNGSIRADVVRGVMEMRSALAPDIARRAALRATAEHRHALTTSMNRLREAPSPSAQQAAALAFWDALVDGSNNVAYRLSFNTLRETYLQVAAALTDLLAVEHGDLAAYQAITDAVLAHDADRAAALATQLIQRGERVLAAVFEASA